MLDDDDFMTAREAAAYLYTTENSLRSMRSTGKGPRFHKPDGWRTLYRKSDLDAYQAECGPTGRKRRMERAMADRERAAPVSTTARP